jgi:hypothetical protein
VQVLTCVNVYNPPLITWRTPMVAFDHADLTHYRLLAVRLLLAMIDEDPKRIRTAMQAIDQHGDFAFRVAVSEIRNHVATWHLRFPPGYELRSGAFIAGTRLILGRTVPESIQTEVLMGFGQLAYEIGEGRANGVVPPDTNNLAADLFLTTVYAAWFASQPDLDPAGKRAQLDGIAAHREHTAIRDGAVLSDTQTATALSVLDDEFGSVFAGSVPTRSGQRGPTEHELLAVAYAHAHATPSSGSLEHLRHLYDLVIQGRCERAEDAAHPYVMRLPADQRPLTAPGGTDWDTGIRAWFTGVLVARLRHPFVTVTPRPAGYSVAWTGEPTVEEMRTLVANVIAEGGIPLDPARMSWARTKLDLAALAETTARRTGDPAAAVLERLRTLKARKGSAGVLNFVASRGIQPGRR